tara:strand:- start:574 stop:852 length:279 start_codon:yes stop_codon:yes gene_type:complete
MSTLLSVPLNAFITTKTADLSHTVTPIAVKHQEVKRIIDVHNRKLEKQKIRDDAAEKFRKEQLTHAGRKRLKNKKKALASERKRLQRASLGT